MSQTGEESIRELSSLLGIEPFYHDMWGNKHHVSLETCSMFLKAMGIDNAGASLKDMKDRPFNRLIDPVMVVSSCRQPNAIPVYLHAEEGQEADIALEVHIEGEDGTSEMRVLNGVAASAWRVIDGKRIIRVDLPNDTSRQIGYYRISVTVHEADNELTGHMTLVIAPDVCHKPSRKTWGVCLNLYALRSETNWGVGDITDLKAMVSAVADEGGGFVGINPMHAITNRMPYGTSPYSPISRLYANFIYLDLRRACNDLGLNIPYEGINARIDALRAEDLIDYEAVSDLKRDILKNIFLAFKDVHLKNDTNYARQFRQYVKAEGGDLETFAVYMALDVHFRKSDPDMYTWRMWPHEYRNSKSDAVAKFSRKNRDAVMFCKFVQWLFDGQLRQAAQDASSMPVGIYGDLAVGSSGDGSDAWGNQEVFAIGVDTGAPPDAFNINGQNWGFPPLAPDKLRDSAYAYFIKNIRQNMRHAGALRIDHALGLFRMFWIPEGRHAKLGAYIKYPYEDLLRIIALESVRSKTVVVAEDLGTALPYMREELQKFGMLSYRLFYFEKDWVKDEFLAPDQYPENAIASVTTHDLPTLKGFLSEKDIVVKSALKLYPDDRTREDDIFRRQRDISKLLESVSVFLPEGRRISSYEEGAYEDILCALYDFLARTRCVLTGVSLDDLLMTENQQNMPGTVESHPNWRQKASRDINEIKSLPSFRRLVEIFKKAGR